MGKQIGGVDMLVINDIEVTKRDLESLLNSLETIKKDNEKGNTGSIDFRLDVLISHLKYNLGADGNAKN